MTKITVELPEPLIGQLEAIASQHQQSLQDVLVTLINQATDNLPLEYLSDDEILRLCDRQMPADEQNQLSDLLAQQREETLSNNGKEQLEDLMQVYRTGLVQKAKAYKIAVDRKLRAPLASSSK